jgi:2-dehydro-3-deoxygluconokinase
MTDPSRHRRKLCVLCVGECMAELSDLGAPDGRIRLTTAGDTLNTAAHLARLLGARARVGYVSLLGSDPLSERMRAEIAARGIDTGLIGRHRDRLPGLYAVALDPGGERRFLYWREASAARALFAGPPPGPEALAGADLLYFSGITLAILAPNARAALLGAARAVRAAGGIVAVDPNHRPALWPDSAAARSALAAAWPEVTIALPSREDMGELHPGEGPAALFARLAAAGVAEIVLKDGARGPRLWAGGEVAAGPFEPAARIVDTTGAGDAFNAGYLAARLMGEGPAAAAAAGHALACATLGHHGALPPLGGGSG